MTNPEFDRLMAALEEVGRDFDRLISEPHRSPYENADEPRDVRMAAQLMAQFKTDPAPSEQVSAAAIIGVPVEDVARQVNLQWLAAITETIQTGQENDPRFGTPDDWAVVCSGHLFEHWARIENIEVIHHNLLPPWSVYLVRSAAWWHQQVINKPLRFNDQYRGSVVLPFPRPHTEKGPSDGSQG